jgi:DNA anti-recombination protein RmuC
VAPLDGSELRWIESELQGLRRALESEAKLRDAFRTQNAAAIERLNDEFARRAENIEATLNNRMDALHREIDAKLDPILDPQTGVYSKLRDGQSSLTRWAIASLTSIILIGVGLLIRALGVE